MEAVPCIGRGIEAHPPGIPLHDPGRAVIAEWHVRDLATLDDRSEHRPAADLRRRQPRLHRLDRAELVASEERRPPAPALPDRPCCAGSGCGARRELRLDRRPPARKVHCGGRRQRSQVSCCPLDGSDLLSVEILFVEGQHSSAKQVNAGTAIHGTFEGLQLVNLSFRLSVAPRFKHGIANGLDILPYCPSKTANTIDARLACVM